MTWLQDVHLAGSDFLGPGSYSVAIPCVRSTKWSAASSSKTPLPLSDSVTKGLNSLALVTLASSSYSEWWPVAPSSQLFPGPPVKQHSSPCQALQLCVASSSAHMTLQETSLLSMSQGSEPFQLGLLRSLGLFFGCSTSAPPALADPYTAIPTFFRFFPIFATNGFHSNPVRINIINIKG